MRGDRSRCSNWRQGSIVPSFGSSTIRWFSTATGRELAERLAAGDGWLQRLSDAVLAPKGTVSGPDAPHRVGSRQTPTFKPHSCSWLLTSDRSAASRPGSRRNLQIVVRAGLRSSTDWPTDSMTGTCSPSARHVNGWKSAFRSSLVVVWLWRCWPSGCTRCRGFSRRLSWTRFQSCQSASEFLARESIFGLSAEPRIVMLIQRSVSARIFPGI